VVAKPTKLDTTACVYVSQHGTNDEVLAFMNRENVRALNLDKIAFRMRDRDFFSSVIGLLQTLATAGIVLSAVWLVLSLLGAPAPSTVRVPLLGDVPAPLATLVAFLIAGYLLARSLGWHAGWIGRRWAREVCDRVGEAVRSEVGQRALRPLDTLEDARRALWTATSTLDDTLWSPVAQVGQSDEPSP